MKKKTSKKLFKALMTLGIIGLIIYVILFIVFYFDLDGKFLYYFVEPNLVKHYDAMERKNPLDSPYVAVPKGQETL